MGQERDFRGQTVVVTGAGSGLGRAFAMAFASRGAGLVCGDIAADRLEDLTKEVTAIGGRAVACVVDVSQAGEAEQLAATARDAFGRLDVLCNVAGINDGAAPADEMSPDVWSRVIAVNLTGTFLVTRAALPMMIEAGAGVIINISSIAGVVAIAGPAYSASKFGVIGFTQSVAATYREDGIRCVAICPGLVPTRLNENVPYSTSARTLRRQSYRQSGATLPGTSEQIADLALFLASPGASFVNGAHIVADGGFLVS